MIPKRTHDHWQIPMAQRSEPFAAWILRATRFRGELVDRYVVESFPFRADPDDHRSVELHAK